MLKKVHKEPLEVGDSVRVKDGYEDPDNPDWNIAGWQGRLIEIIEVNPPMILVEWDSITLKNMPASIIEECEEEGLEWAEYQFFPTDVERATARDTQADVKEIKYKLQAQFSWVSLGEEGRRIQQVLAGLDLDDDFEVLHAWEDYLTEKLTFPFEAVIAEFQEYGPLHHGDKVRVYGIADVDEHYGLIAKSRYKGTSYHLPLADLAARDKASLNYQPLSDYSVWFANR